MTNTRRATAWAAAVIASGAAIVATTHADAASKTNNFQMQRSPGIVAAGCLPDAKAKVSIRNRGPVEEMKVHATGLPHRTDFDVFVIQVPNAPFGVSWYQGDLETDQQGVGERHVRRPLQRGDLRGRTRTAPAPSVHSSPIPDAGSNPAFGPIHTFHLGLWFNSPKDAVKAGCPGATTPFNGEHNAGVQVLNTDQFGDRHGPLRRLKP